MKLISNIFIITAAASFFYSLVYGFLMHSNVEVPTRKNNVLESFVFNATFLVRLYCTDKFLSNKGVRYRKKHFYSFALFLLLFSIGILLSESA